ncbi:hypothetical protein BaRGS_00030632 [Batillaria attramentaria]|uniref:Uncharacterized protein n=1 Tax=Batillaria attramentaria TaxID=370345 RepID=A0ABD0JTY7_9CAEN
MTDFQSRRRNLSITAPLESRGQDRTTAVNRRGVCFAVWRENRAPSPSCYRIKRPSVVTREAACQFPAHRMFDDSLTTFYLEYADSTRCETRMKVSSVFEIGHY